MYDTKEVYILTTNNNFLFMGKLGTWNRNNISLSILRVYSPVNLAYILPNLKLIATELNKCLYYASGLYIQHMKNRHR